MCGWVVEDLSTPVVGLWHIGWRTLVAVPAYLALMSKMRAPSLDHAASFLVVYFLRTQRDTVLSVFVLFASCLIMSNAFAVLEVKSVP